MFEVVSAVLLRVGEGSPPDAFFNSLCEAICRLTSMRRAVLFRYDNARRRVRAVGAHGIELERFGELYVTVDSVPIARRALAEDRVLEVLGAADFDVPSSLRAYLAGMRMLCTPMTAAGRYVGVVISEPDPSSPRPDDERQMLWTLGKAVAMASLAREVTTYDERSRQLQQRINLARDIHEHVIQRLFGVSLALSREELLDAETQHRCASEIQAALGELRAALERPLGHTSRPTALTFAEELSRLRGLHSEVEIVLERGDPQSVPAQLEPLAQSILVEAVRNVQKHSRASHIGVSLSSDGGNFVLQVRNDGADVPHGGRGGVGLRLATLEALQFGGVLEYGEPDPGIWQVRLVVPIRQ